MARHWQAKLQPQDILSTKGEITSNHETSRQHNYTSKTGRFALAVQLEPVTDVVSTRHTTGLGSTTLRQAEIPLCIHIILAHCRPLFDTRSLIPETGRLP